MRRILVSLLLISIILAPVSFCEDSPAYSLGTMQPTNTYRVSPGETTELEFYIFNAYGNRISHITLAVGENPGNFEVILPELKSNQWNISGIITTIEEHLYVEAMPVVLEQPIDPPEGIYYLKSTNVTGYIPAKKVVVSVVVPETAELGTTHKLTINALAKWYGDTGTAQVSQARPFLFNLIITTEEYTESLYTPSGETGGLGISIELAFGVVVVVLVLVILFQQFRSKKRR